MRLIASLLISLAIALSLAACAAPTTTPPATGNLAGTTPPPPPEPPRAPPPMSSPTPPREVRQEAAIDTSCKSNADCAVKNVGNCCGAMPACVNKDSPTDPAAVQAQCAAKGMMSTCGFAEISTCQCDNGQCAPAGDAAPQVQ